VQRREVAKITPALREPAPYRVAATPDVMTPDQTHCVKEVSSTGP